VLGGVVAVAVVLHVGLVWLPVVGSIGLSLTSWDGVGFPNSGDFVGLENYVDLATSYPAFWPAVVHNALWLGAYLFLATPLAILLAVMLDRQLRGAAFYQSALYLPVMLSLAVIGLIWELQFAPEQGFINSALGTNRQDNLIDWLGDRSINLWAVLVAACWRHVGYVVVLYLAALRAVDPTLREAAAIDGASEAQTFRRVTFPVLAPMNVVIVVITVIEALRAFDLVYVINRGTNGLEVLAVLVTNNILGEASRIGFGSAIATVMLVLSVVPIVLYLRRSLGERAS
jgi:multiple sugar transport system permease protein